RVHEFHSFPTRRSSDLSALIWQQMEAAGIVDLQGVWCDEAGGARLLTIVSIKQRYLGHAKQAGMVASYCHAGGYLGRRRQPCRADRKSTRMNSSHVAIS